MTIINKVILIFIASFLSAFNANKKHFDIDENGIAKVVIILKNHVFYPSNIYVPKSMKIVLEIHNEDDSIEEFESPSLRREKLLKSRSITRIMLAPLSKGRYDFIGEFHQETANGAIIVE